MTAPCPCTYHACNTGAKRGSTNYFGHVAHTAVWREQVVGKSELIRGVPEYWALHPLLSPLALC